MPHFNNSHVAQMNINHDTRHLLLWLIGLSLFNILLLVFMVLLILFASALQQRYTNWKSISTLHRRQLLMRKHNLVASMPSPLLSGNTSCSNKSSSAVATVLDSSVVPMSLSATMLSQQLAEDKQLMTSFTRDLQVTQDLR